MNHFNTSIVPPNESERLLKLENYQILNTPEEITFIRIAQIAAQIFNTPYAQINFIAESNVFTKASIGLPSTLDYPRAQSLCALTILNKKLTFFNDEKDVELINFNSAFYNNINIKSYVAAPIITTDGFALGTVCVYGTSPLPITEQQCEILNNLASLILDELTVRQLTQKVIAVQSEMMNSIVHDLKNPNTTISLAAELIKKKAEDPLIVANFSDRIRNATALNIEKINRLMAFPTPENSSFRLNITDTNILDTLHLAVNRVKELALAKNQEIELFCDKELTVLADATRLTAVLEILLHNAIKFAERSTQIKLMAKKTAKELLIEVKDHGQGIPADEIAVLFDKLTKFSAIPTAKENSYGIGLYIAKMLVEIQKGSIWATSDGKNKGASFFIALPIY